MSDENQFSLPLEKPAPSTNRIREFAEHFSYHEKEGLSERSLQELRQRQHEIREELLRLADFIDSVDESRRQCPDCGDYVRQYLRGQFVNRSCSCGYFDRTAFSDDVAIAQRVKEMADDDEPFVVMATGQAEDQSAGGRATIVKHNSVIDRIEPAHTKTFVIEEGDELIMRHEKCEPRDHMGELRGRRLIVEAVNNE